MQYVEYIIKIVCFGGVIIIAEILKWWAALMITGILKVWGGHV